MRDEPDDQMLTYPTDKVVGIVRDRGSLQAVHEALRASAVDDDRVEVLCSRDVSDQGAIEDGGHGPLASAVRIVRTALGDEAPRLRALNEALDRGEYVVQVEIPREDGDVVEEEKRAVGNALKDVGAEDVAFYDRLAVEDLEFEA